MEITMADATTEETAAVETSDDSTTEATATEATTTEAPEVRDPAKLLNAYEAEKAKRKEQDAAIRDLRSELDAIKAKAEGKEAEFAAQQEAQRVKDEALAVANDRILKAEVRAQAAAKLADPQDALRFLDLSGFEVGPDGEVDASLIASAIEDLITKKPYLAAQGGKKFQGSADGGARNDANKVSQLSRSDMDRMSPEQKAAAYDAGQFDDLLGRS
jgi:hypothetical protein